LKKIGFYFLLILAILQGNLMATTIKYIDIKGVQIPVIFEEQKSLPILNLQLVFQNSGYVQDKDKSGLASLSSKLLNEGTKELGASKFAEKLEENAISLTTSNGFETFVIELSNLKEQSKKGINLLTELLKSPNYSKSTLEKLKTIQTGSLKRKENDFDYVSNNQLKSILFKGTTLQNPASGTIESISKIKLKDIENFINQTVCLENLIIVAGGDYELAEFEELVKPLLETLNVGKKLELEKIKFTSKKEEKELIKDTKQAYIYFGSSFNVDSKDEENYKAKVASFILGGSGFGSRLMEEIRVKRGLAYSAYGSISINKSYSYFNGYLQTKNESANEAKQLVTQLVEEFVNNGVTQEELTAAKNFLTGSEPLRSETLSQRLTNAFTLYYRGLEADYSKKELEKIQNLELKDLNEYIKSHNEINNLTFSIVRK
jgi:predicted Zn-dependent peptidase